MVDDETPAPPDLDPNAILTVVLRVYAGDDVHDYEFDTLMGSMEWTVLGFLYKQGYDPQRVEFEVFFDNAEEIDEAHLQKSAAEELTQMAQEDGDY